MIKKTLQRLLIFLLIFSFTSFFSTVSAQNQSAVSNMFCTNVGDTKDPSPCTSFTGQCNSTPSVPGNYRQSLINDFGISMEGSGEGNYSVENYQWAWEKLCSVSNTKFIDLIHGNAPRTPLITVRYTKGMSNQASESLINFKPPLSPAIFNVVLLHEMAHLIQHYNTDDRSFGSDHADVLATEKPYGVTGYGGAPCWGTPAINEDYAEMITYFLNPDIVEVILCNNRGVVPYGDGRNPMHYNLAKKILLP